MVMHGSTYLAREPVQGEIAVTLPPAHGVPATALLQVREALVRAHSRWSHRVAAGPVLTVVGGPAGTADLVAAAYLVGLVAGWDREQCLAVLHQADEDELRRAALIALGGLE